MNDEAPHDSPLRSVHTTNFPNLLEEIQASLLVTTYQAGKLVILRNNDGVLNTHFRSFEKPMGLAVSGGKLALGTNVEVWEFHNVPAACRQLDNRSINEATSDELTLLRPKHDACYLPRRVHTTGDVQIHEMAWVGEELWFINTAFSCLCARSDVYSFQPRWLPPFINHLVPSDCCHLNGMAIRDGRLQYVTALGATGAPAGWRSNKRNGGVLIEVASGEILLQGLSMPHSPR